MVERSVRLAGLLLTGETRDSVEGVRPTLPWALSVFEGAQQTQLLQLVTTGSVRKLYLLQYAFSLSFHLPMFLLQFSSVFSFLTYFQSLIPLSAICERYACDWMEFVLDR